MIPMDRRAQGRPALSPASQTKLPKLTHLQFIVLRLAEAKGGLAGPDVREQVSEYSGKTAQSAFWKTMERLERAGYLDGSYEHSLGDHGAMMRRYVTTEAGREAC